MCLHRTTIAGRNFEYFSEDPYLSGVMGVAVTRAIQAHGVIAMGKHHVVNDQEYERFRTSVEVDEHVLRELYLLPFGMLVKDAEIAAIMSAYNRIRGVYATEYRYTLTDVLRTEWGFDGYVQSDFWSCRSAAPSLNAGMDHEMPDAKWLNEDNIKAASKHQSRDRDRRPRAGPALHPDSGLCPVARQLLDVVLGPGRHARRSPRSATTTATTSSASGSGSAISRGATWPTPPTCGGRAPGTPGRVSRIG